MASKKRSVSRKNTRKKNRKNTASGRIRRFFRAAGISALITFSVVSCALNPSVHNNVIHALEPLLGQFDLETLSLEGLGVQRFATTGWPPAPVAVPIDGTVQTSFASCRQLFPGQTPAVPVAPLLRELCFSSFAILHSGKTRTPVFVAQRLNRTMLVNAKNVQRTDRFYAEARLPSAERAELNDYRGSGYSRGHMAPAGDMHDDTAMAQSFSLANMVPQDQTHNAGAWNKIENDTRKYVMRAKGDVYIFTGPVYAAEPEMIGEGRVAVPSHLYKVVYDATTERSWVHWHVHSADTRAGVRISYSEFVRRTGLHLLSFE